LNDKIKLSSEELGLMSLFQSLTGATTKDCIIDQKMDRVIFVISQGQMGLAIGRSGETIKKVQKVMGRQVELVEWSEEPKQLLMNCLNPQLIKEIRMVEKPDGTQAATIFVEEKKKGAILGKGGKNAEKARLLAKRYFSIETIHIVSAM
jgi:transcription termination/antitermination protein NusA